MRDEQDKIMAASDDPVDLLNEPLDKACEEAARLFIEEGAMWCIRYFYEGDFPVNSWPSGKALVVSVEWMDEDGVDE